MKIGIYESMNYHIKKHDNHEIIIEHYAAVENLLLKEEDSELIFEKKEELEE